MECSLFANPLLTLFGIIIAALSVKIYIFLTTGRYKITKSLKGTVVLITGGTAGIGKETVRELAKNHATIHILARDIKKAERVIGEIKESTGNEDIHIHYLDLSDFSTIRSFAKKFLATESPIHILINNAGLISKARTTTVDGNEETAQANHLGHFLLTNLLLDRIIQSGPSRIVNVSSIVHTWVNSFDPYDINFQKRPADWTDMQAYSRSKLMNVIFTTELARRMQGKGVTVNTLHPGAVATEFQKNISSLALLIFSVIARPFFKSENEGAQTTLYLATADIVSRVSGQYFADCKIAPMNVLAADEQLGLDLWKESERITGL